LKHKEEEEANRYESRQRPGDKIEQGLVAGGTLDLDQMLNFRVSHTMLLCFCVMLRFLSRAAVFLAFPPPPPLLLFALNLPCRLADEADALLGMVNSKLLLLHLLLPRRTEA
jgi:hypothetical protein